MSGELDLTDNTTCQLVMEARSGAIPVHFYTVNYTALALNTPLEGFFTNPRLLSSKHRPGHTADALRLGNFTKINFQSR